MNNIELFRIELNRIKDENVRKSTEAMLDILPDYFFEVPAYIDKNNHPTYALGYRGLVRHTKVTEYILEEYFKNSIFAPVGEYTRDLMRMAIILHDGLKFGYEYSNHTIIDHPMLMANCIIDSTNSLSINVDDAMYVADLISTHMGPFVYDEQGNKVLDEPKTKEQILIHECDFIASIPFLDIKFKNNEIVNNIDSEITLKLNNKQN